MDLHILLQEDQNNIHDIIHYYYPNCHIFYADTYDKAIDKIKNKYNIQNSHDVYEIFKQINQSYLTIVYIDENNIYTRRAFINISEKDYTYYLIRIKPTTNNCIVFMPHYINNTETKKAEYPNQMNDDNIYLHIIPNKISETDSTKNIIADIIERYPIDIISKELNNNNLDNNINRVLSNDEIVSEIINH